MTIGHALFIILLCTITGSYTWGMRGTIIGGERGAMLPGAALALVLLCAGRVAPVSEAFAFAAAIGAAAMFFGGTQTYGETIGLTLLKDDKKERWRGRIGLAVKGANWFGIFGGILAVGLGAMAGRYSLLEMCLFTVLLPIVKMLGFFVFNFPQKPAQNKFPKLYFSKKRHEVWGGLTMICLYLIVFAIVEKEWFVLIMTVVGFITGGLGFWIGNLFQTGTHGPRPNGKYLLGKFEENGFVGSWKFMECAFGAIGGLGVSLCWCLCYDRFVSVYAQQIVAHSGVWQAFNIKTQNILTLVWLFIFLLFVLRYIFPEPGALRADVEKKFRSGEIAEDRYRVLMETAVDKAPPKIAVFLYQIEDIMAWIVFCYVPLFLVLIGNGLTAEIYAFTMVLYVIGDKICFGGGSHYRDVPGAPGFHAVLLLLPAVSLVVQLFTDFTFSARCTFLMYGISYLLAEYYVVFNPWRMRALCREKGSLGKALLSLSSSLSWMSYAAVCVIAMSVMGIFALK